MNSDQWQKAKDLFEAARQCPPDKRRRFLDENCGGDADVRREVESLLATSDDAASFLEQPAVGEVAEIIAGQKSLTGKTFGHYKILQQIGAGGMGEVYLAKDKKLDRQVAIKILNEQFSCDDSNLGRFTQEAKSASSLNHPHILVIYEIGTDGDAHYIVSEFVEGKTLREHFKQSPMKLSEVLDVSIQIAGALTAAHGAHIIHRDIKPENIMVRPDGYIKILDFGLAKLVEQQKSLISLEDETVEQNQTAKGVILGTVNYMSPEQAKGERVDERTDVFSLGIVIYEMIAGRTPFAGDSVSETFANLINAEPQPLLRYASNIPDEMQRMAAKMLRKNKDERYQTMKDVLTDLKDVQRELEFQNKLERTIPPNREEAKTQIINAATTDAPQTTSNAKSLT
ncbi:MAG: serine/threonine protein kinase, partial [Acidobacteria bacterium]|nr:serine/threonine protein kinase [Acidobacteriota bacterium]